MFSTKRTSAPLHWIELVLAMILLKYCSFAVTQQSLTHQMEYMHTCKLRLFCIYASSLAKGYDPLLSTLGRLSRNFVIPTYRPLADL